MTPLADCQLYTFIDTAYLRGRSPGTLARQLCDGGADLIQLRAKGCAPEQVERLAALLLPIVQAAGVGLVVNDHPRVALSAGAPLCHMGQEDFFDAGFTHVRELSALGSAELRPVRALQVGLSTHAPAQAARALAAGADYLAIGPVFPTPTKPQAAPVTLDYVRWAAQHVDRPWFAIGGITIENLDRVLEAGARRVCIVSAILLAPDVTKACQEFKNRLLSAGRTG